MVSLSRLVTSASSAKRDAPQQSLFAAEKSQSQIACIQCRLCERIQESVSSGSRISLCQRSIERTPSYQLSEPGIHTRAYSPALDEVGHVHGHFLDLSVVEGFYVFQSAVVVCSDEVGGDTFSPESATTSDPVRKYTRRLYSPRNVRSNHEMQNDTQCKSASVQSVFVKLVGAD